MKKRFILLVVVLAFLGIFLLKKAFAIKPPDWIDVGNEKNTINFR